MPTNILHLEDDKLLSEVLREAIQIGDSSVEITHFDNSDDAATYLEKHLSEIHLFVLDIRVPGQFDGLQLAQKIRALSTTHRIVITSAFRPPHQDLLTTLNAEWIAKPWRLMQCAQYFIEIAQRQALS